MCLAQLTRFTTSPCVYSPFLRECSGMPAATGDLNGINVAKGINLLGQELVSKTAMSKSSVVIETPGEDFAIIGESRGVVTTA